MDKFSTNNQPFINLGVRTGGDLKELEDGMAVAKMKILSLDVPTKNATRYTVDTFSESKTNNPILTVATGPSDIQHVMSPEEFAERMKALKDEDYSKFDSFVYAGNIDERHIEADNLMTRILDSLGYSEGCQIFHEMDKWYD